MTKGQGLKSQGQGRGQGLVEIGQGQGLVFVLEETNAKDQGLTSLVSTATLRCADKSRRNNMLDENNVTKKEELLCA